MYGQRNTPAQTPMSHWLRTGRNLPVETVLDQKAEGPIYDLIVKLVSGEIMKADFCMISRGMTRQRPWSTNSFVAHYFCGNGRSTNLQDIGLLRKFRGDSSVKYAVNGFEIRQINRAERWVNNLSERDKKEKVVRTSFSDKATTVTDVRYDIDLYSVGGSTFFMSSNYNVTLEPMRGMLSLEGSMTFQIKDVFKEPLHIIGNIGKGFEIPGGTPYSIVTKWSQPIQYNKFQVVR